MRIGISDSLAVDEGADGQAAEGVGKISVGCEIEDDDGDVIVHAEAEGGGVHDVEPLGEALLEGDGVVADGVGIFPWVAIVNTVHLGGLEDDVCTHLTGAEGGGGVGGEEGIPGAGGEDDDLAAVELALRLAADEGLCDVFHFDGGLDDAGDAMVLKRAFEGESIHDGGQHADVVCGGAVHAAGGGAGSAPEISTADDDAKLKSALHGLADFEGDAVHDFWRNVVP